MIHQLLSLTRPLIVLDVESTGTDPESDRIVQLGFQAWDATGVTKEFKTLVNPGVPIPSSSTKVHGITDDRVYGCRECGLPLTQHPPDTPEHQMKPWPRFKQLCAAISTGFVDCDFAGKRVRFDLRITAAEMARNGVPWSYLDARIVDADRLEQLAIPRSLAHLYEKYAPKMRCPDCEGSGGTITQHCVRCNGDGSILAVLDGAHDALHDVRATSVVIAGQLQTHPCLPRDLDALHRAQWPGWIDGSGKFRFVDGVPCFTNWGKHAGKPMDHPDVLRSDRGRGSYYDFILGGDFPADVKELARRAKLGQFPEVSDV